MGFRGVILGLLVIGCANAQLFKVCVPSTENTRCQNMNIDGSQVQCERVETRVECAARMARNAADVGVFSEEELLLLAQRNPNDHRVLATVRDVSRMEPYAFEAVVVVPNNHTNGLEGLRGGRYCHPGLGVADLRWSPRVLKALETAAARTDRCEGSTDGKTAEELEVETLSRFFSAACRPGPWSLNATVDANLKSRFPNLCDMCTEPGVCAGYANNQVNIAGLSNSNRHVQALDCLRTNGTVAYVAWQHVREYFNIARPDDVSRFSLLCENGTVVPLSAEILNSHSSPCAFVRQPWRAIVATSARADALLEAMKTWWPAGADAGGSAWLTSLYAVLAGGANMRLVYQEFLQTPLEYTSPIRSIPNIDASTGCLPARRWCTTSAQELDKCAWVRAAAYSLGIQPAVSCQQRASAFECLADIRDQRADFFTADTHYGYIARRHFKLSAVKLVQNSRETSSRIAALIKDSASNNITRFENLRDKVACFPEFGGLAYVAFLRRAQDIGVISANECDYVRAVGEFFSGACAPGALDAAHSISAPSNFNATRLCTACRPRPIIGGNNVTADNFTCAWDYTNEYFNNYGSLLCLDDPATDVAFVEVQDIQSNYSANALQTSRFRALCANNTLSGSTGVNVDDSCLIAHLVDAEVLMRRNCQMYNSVNAFLDTIDHFFGYSVAASEQLVNLHIYSSFDGVSDLLFKDSTVGLLEPVVNRDNPTASNYINLFSHLETCTSGVAPVPDAVSRTLFSFVTLAFMALLTLVV